MREWVSDEVPTQMLDVWIDWCSAGSGQNAHTTSAQCSYRGSPDAQHRHGFALPAPPPPHTHTQHDDLNHNAKKSSITLSAPAYTYTTTPISRSTHMKGSQQPHMPARPIPTCPRCSHVSVGVGLSCVAMRPRLSSSAHRRASASGWVASRNSVQQMVWAVVCRQSMTYTRTHRTLVQDQCCTSKQDTQREIACKEGESCCHTTYQASIYPDSVTQ